MRPYNRPMTETERRTTRTERDSMGEMEVPADALYGASTQRAVLNFPISGSALPARFLRALALVKQAAADTNGQLGLLEPDVAAAIAAAAAEVAAGGHDDQFPIDIYQTGSGTSTNTNMNEVVAHLASARLGGRAVHPNDDVNRCQSSNDTIPTALQLSAAIAIEDELLPALERLHTALVAKEQELWPIVKTGRTHLQDATPIRLGQEFRGYAGQVEESLRRARAAQAELLVVPLGGTAVGTGINAHPEYAFRACARLSVLTGLTVREATNHFHAQATLDAADRRARRDPDHRAEPVEDRLGCPADGHGPARRDRRAGVAGDPAGVEHHARQGEPGHRREPDDGRRPGRRQRRDGRVRPDRELPRAQRDAPGDRRRDARVDLAAGRRDRQLQRPLHRGRDGHRSGSPARRAGPDAGDRARPGHQATERGPELVEQGLMLATARRR